MNKQQPTPEREMEKSYKYASLLEGEKKSTYHTDP